jgi:hypothetical protein
LKKAVSHYYPPLAPKRNFIEYLKDALNETYLRSMSPKKRQKTNFLAHFMGWPGGKGAGAWVGYVFFGFLLTPLKNILKTVELAAKCVSQTFKFIQERFGRFQPTNTAVRFIYNFTWAIFCFIPYVAAALAAWAISAVTSPMANYRAGLDKEHFGAPALASAVVTVFAYAAIMVAAAPLIALIAAKLGFGATVKSVGEAVSGISTLSDITTPVAWTAAHTGAVSAAGEAFISTATAAFLAVRGMVASFLEKCFDGEKVSYSRTVKPKVTGGSSNGSRLSSSTASISRNMSFVPSVNVSEEKRNSLDGEREPLVVPTQAPQPRRELGSYHSVSSGPR